MKIYSIISSIEQELEESPRTKFGGQSRRVVEIERLYDLLGDLKVTIPEEPQNCVVLGAGKAIQYIDDMENKNYGVLNPLSAAY